MAPTLSVPALESMLGDGNARATIAAAIDGDPAGAARALFGADVWPGQARILDSLFRPLGLGGNRTTVVGSGHATGKSHAVALATQLWLARGWPATNVLIFAASEDALKTRIFRTIARLVADGGGSVRWATAPLKTEWSPGPSVSCVGQALRGEGEGKQGYHPAGGLLTQVDEASALDKARYETIVSGLMTGPRDRVLLVGNPLHTDGPFADALGDGREGTIHISSLESPNIVWARLAHWMRGRARGDFDARAVADAIWEWFPEPGRAVIAASRLVPTVAWVWERVRERGPNWVEAWERDPEIVPGLAGPGWLSDQLREFGADGDEFRTRVLGLVPETGTDELFSRSAFTDAAKRDTERRGGRRILGGDVGAVGDPTVIFVRDDVGVIDCIELRSPDRAGWRARVRDAVVEMWRKHDCDEGYLDDTAIGFAIADEIRAETGIRTLWGLMPGGAASDPERFVNQRSELAFRARDWLARGAIPRKWAEKLRAESGIRWETDKTTSRKRLEPKPEFKKRLGHSPDYMDAFCYTFGALPGPVAFEAARGLREPPGDVEFQSRGIVVKHPHADEERIEGRPWRASWFNPGGASACIVGLTDKLGGMVVARSFDSPEAMDLGEWCARVRAISLEGRTPIQFEIDVIGYPEDLSRIDEGHGFRRELIQCLRATGWEGGVPRLADRNWLEGPGGVEVLNRLVLGGLARSPEDDFWKGREGQWLRYAALPALRVWPRDVRDALNHARFEGKKRGEDPTEDPSSEFVAGGGAYLRCLRMLCGMGAVARIREEEKPVPRPDPMRYGPTRA